MSKESVGEVIGWVVGGGLLGVVTTGITFFKITKSTIMSMIEGVVTPLTTRIENDIENLRSATKRASDEWETQDGKNERAKYERDTNDRDQRQRTVLVKDELSERIDEEAKITRFKISEIREDQKDSSNKIASIEKDVENINNRIDAQDRTGEKIIEILESNRKEQKADLKDSEKRSDARSGRIELSINELRKENR